MNERLINKKIRSQMGFTLLELLVVFAVIGVLASLAVPRLQSQVQKARFINVINSAAPVKAAIETCFQKKGVLASCTAGNNEIPADVGLIDGNNSVVVTANGVITAQGNVDNGFNGVAQTYILTPTAVNGGLTWAVGGSCTASNYCN